MSRSRAKAALPGPDFPRGWGTGEPIDRSAPVGTYALDAAAAEVVEIVLASGEPTDLGRLIIGTAGKAAARMSGAIRALGPRHDAAARLLATLELAQRQCTSIARTDVSAVAGMFDSGDLIDQIGDIEALVDAAKELEERARAFQARYQLMAKAGEGAARLLEREFVASARMYFETFTGHPAPRSKDGPFVRFLAAGWRDLGFDEIEDLEGTLGSYAERL